MSRRLWRHITIFFSIVCALFILNLFGEYYSLNVDLKRVHELSKEWGMPYDLNLINRPLIVMQTEGVFIDVGSGAGDALIKFYKGKVYKDDPNFNMVMDYDPWKWRVYAFEADPKYTSQLVKLEERFKFSLYSNMAAWVHDEGLMYPVNRTGVPSRTHNLVREKEHNPGYISAFSINFPLWLRGYVTKKDFVVVRMNLRGLEFEVLDKLVSDLSLCLIDQLYVDYYPKLAITKDPSIPAEIPGWVTRMSRMADCSTEIVMQSEHV
ncbi:uncharacterized protein LOC100379018 [Saccoglossus kowalevskii]|uniref:Uncharacterized protein LOC100379018 n=1 Tax=Saccoglossus kowalevskii TaxID=10224 RepID=A0ABM0GRE1_SACKO|nr:PREDICTED: uncharacterized protein LOC100379018 [Saccoglossus kowalevskii]